MVESLGTNGLLIGGYANIAATAHPTGKIKKAMTELE